MYSNPPYTVAMLWLYLAIAAPAVLLDSVAFKSVGLTPDGSGYSPKLDSATASLTLLPMVSNENAPKSPPSSASKAPFEPLPWS
jgi:hypothetical protein